MTRIAVPAIILLLVVATYVGLAGWNRSGERLSITLTERELTLPWRPPGQGLGLRFQIAFEPRREPLDARNWLSDARLRALGFPLNVPVGDPSAAAAYRDVPARVAWIVLEYDGPAFKEIERRRALRPSVDSRVTPRPPSRLVPIDAGLDLDELRDRYGAGHLIVRAVIALSYLGSSSGGPLLYGWVREQVPASITVPRDLVPVLDGLQPFVISMSPDAQRPPDLTPRYEVDLGVGRLGIPFIKGLRRTNPPNPPNPP